MPNAQELIDVARTAIQGQGDEAADFIRGSDYESLVGATAVLYNREGRRDDDLFNATKFHTAEGTDLTELVKRRFGVDRYLDARGVGVATLERPTSAAGAGTVWAGTRIVVVGGSPKFYRVSENTPVAAGALSAEVPIEAVSVGPGSLISQTNGLRIDDSLWDSTWTVAKIACTDGTRFEPAPDLIARVRRGRRDSRVGHVKKIEAVCKSVGADKVVLFRSDFGGTLADGGLNVCYVGDAGYSSSPALVKACTLALRSVRVLGDHLQVLQMSRGDLSVSVDVYLRDIPQVFDTARLEQIHRSAITQYLGGTTGGFTFSKMGIAGAIIRNTEEVQNVAVVTPAADVGVLAAGAFPAVLQRYVVSDIAIRYRGPL